MEESGTSQRPLLEVADLVREFGPVLRRIMSLTPDQSAVLRAIVACRTAELGGHLDSCDQCEFSRPSYNSCRNRHCPKCQSGAQEKWITQRAERILPTGHFHVVFTVPDSLHRLAAYRREEFFQALFAAASQTLLELGETRLGLTLGITSVLHTWTRDLRFHPHVHCLVTAGGLSLDKMQWISLPKFLLPVRVIGALFRGKLMAELKKLYARQVFAGFDEFQDPLGFSRLMAKIAKKRWVVYAKRPFGTKTHVLSYLGRYTHRVGISNRRLLSKQGDQITFATKNGQSCTLNGVDFLRRFVQHVLPKGFTKIRHYGLYASKHSDSLCAQARRMLQEKEEVVCEPEPSSVGEKTADDQVDELCEPLPLCPMCKVGWLKKGPLPASWDSS